MNDTDNVKANMCIFGFEGVIDLECQWRGDIEAHCSRADAITGTLAASNSSNPSRCNALSGNPKRLQCISCLS